ncbi:MAG TPA: hypothetical protein VGE35_02655 [Candidatus Paceibacterota bacterium]
MENIKKAFWDTQKSRTITIVVLSFIAALVILKIGMFIGYHKALFAYRSDERHFIMMKGGEGMGAGMRIPSPRIVREEFPTGYGATGRVMSVSLPSFIIASPDNTERTITVNGDTMIRRFKSTVPATDIKTDDFTVILGEPDESGTIRAKFIRLTDENAVFTISTTSKR